MSTILEVRNLTKHYGSFTAVDGISFSIEPGEIVGLLGPNGAGKTTTINLILGLLEPSAGSITVFGKDSRAHRSEIAGRVNFAASYALLPGNLTVWENLYIFALLYDVPNARHAIDTMLGLVGLDGLAKKKTGVLSSGEQSRLGIAKALLNNPELLLLDEPTASLDPDRARDIRALIQKRAKEEGVAIFWTSHNMHEIEAVCDRVLFLAKGKILLEGDPKKLPAQFNKENLEELFISIARQTLNHG